jgi:hypothetical protein
MEEVVTDTASEVPFGGVRTGGRPTCARHVFIDSGRPRRPAASSGSQQTILEECWKPAFARYLTPKYSKAENPREDAFLEGQIGRRC